jgi:hypothetical protein
LRPADIGLWSLWWLAWSGRYDGCSHDEVVYNLWVDEPIARYAAS